MHVGLHIKGGRKSFLVMSVNTIGIENVSEPWWVASLPAFTEPPSRDGFYQILAAVRSKSYLDRVKYVSTLDIQALVKFAVLTEALGLDKSLAGKFIRLFKLVKSVEDFKNKVDTKYKSLVDNVDDMFNTYERRELVDQIRMSLLPKKEQKLTDAQKAGYAALEALDKARVAVNAEYEAEEKALAEQLRAVRARRDDFNTKLLTVFTGWANIKKSRKLTLTHLERQGLMTRYESNVELQNRYTVEGYLAAARANKIALTERSYYDSFRGLGTETEITRRVRAIKYELDSKASAEGPRAERQGSPNLDEISPQ